MLQGTFCHIPGLGLQTEQRLWDQGCLSWDDFLEEPDRWKTGTSSAGFIADQVRLSRTALEEGVHQHFRIGLGGRHAWRAWPEFQDRAVCLDIETDGGRDGHSITMVGLYDGSEFICLTPDDGLASFPDLISRWSMIVTFFGSGFDLPMLRKAFPRVDFDQIHIDLCPTLKQLGLRGGLKRIEAELGLARPKETQGLTGWDAVLLWRRHLRGDASALPLLTAYNREDVVNLWTLAEIAYGRLAAASGWPGSQAAVMEPAIDSSI